MIRTLPFQTCRQRLKLAENRLAGPALLHGRVMAHRYSTAPTSADATAVPDASGVSHHGNPLHGSYHWYFERFVAINTLGLITAMVVLPETHTIVDMGLNLFLPLHCHLGLGCIITDYVPRRKFRTAYPILRAALISSTLIATYGIYRFNTNDIGVSALVRKLWTTEQKDN